MIKKLYISLLLMLSAGLMHAQLIPNFGSQRAGLATLSFLKNDVNTRSVALSGASVALDGDAYSVYTNPSAIANIKELSFGLSNYSLGAGIQQSFVSGIIPRKNKLGAFGVSVNMLNSGAMDVRTEFQPEGTGEKFYVTNTAFGLSYAQKLSDMFSAGISLKYINEQIESFSNSTVASDVSFLYYTDYKDLKFSVVVQNFGGNSSIDGGDLQTDFNRNNSIEAEEYTVPTVFRLGASLVPWEKDNHSLLIAVQLNHPNDNAENYRLGAEYEYKENLFVRTGYKINVKGQPYPSFGFGVRANVNSHSLYINYAAVPTDFQGTLHNIGLAFKWNKMERE